MERISLDPVPVEKWLTLSDREKGLQAIADNVGYWLKWVTKEHGAEGIEIGPDTAIMLPGDSQPPVWPSVDQLTNWLRVLRDIPEDEDADQQ